MESDWYSTKREGTYLVVKSGSPLVPVLLDPRLSGLIDDRHAQPFITRLESRWISAVIDVYGIDDCLKLRGFCLVRSPTPVSQRSLAAATTAPGAPAAPRP